jgi:hypothetical protein
MPPSQPEAPTIVTMGLEEIFVAIFYDKRRKREAGVERLLLRRERWCASFHDPKTWIGLMSGREIVE